jgi:hypothetical protein
MISVLLFPLLAIRIAGRPSATEAAPAPATETAEY